MRNSPTDEIVNIMDASATLETDSVLNMFIDTHFIVSVIKIAAVNISMIVILFYMEPVLQLLCLAERRRDHPSNPRRCLTHFYMM